MRLACGVALAVGLGGCVQATRHSNTMVFGTNTSVGLKVGTDVSSVPGIQVGYNRQEAVILPLLANVNETSVEAVGGGTLNRLVPCDVGQVVQVLSAEDDPGFPVHPCLFVATRDGAADSYSVLASFGAEFGAKQGTSLEAQGGLAQYFATGMAAQLLATTGGASVVNASADPPGPEAAIAAAALFGNEDQRNRAVVFASQYGDFKTRLVELIGLDADDDTMLTRLQNFETRINALAKLSDDCQTKSDCLSILAQPGETPFSNQYRVNRAGLLDALNKWATPIS